MPVFNGIAGRLALTAQPTDIADAATRVGNAPLDTILTALAGHPLESLDDVPRPVFTSTTRRVSTDSLQVLLTGSTRARIGAAYGSLARSDRGTAESRELQDVGWVNRDGKLTRSGARAGAALAADREVMIVKARRGDRGALLIASDGPGGVLVAHDPAVSEACDDSETGAISRHVAMLDLAHVPVFVSAWLGLTPRWSVRGASNQVSAEDLFAHFAAAGDGDVEPWTEVLIRGGGSEIYGAISPTRGWLRIGAPVDGIHPLHAEVASVVFDHLAAVCTAVRV